MKNSTISRQWKHSAREVQYGNPSVEEFINWIMIWKTLIANRPESDICMVSRRDAIKSGIVPVVFGMAGCAGNGDSGNGDSGNGDSGNGDSGNGDSSSEEEGGSGDVTITVGGAASGTLANRSWQGIRRAVLEGTADSDIYDGEIDLNVQETRGGGASQLRYTDEGEVDAGGASNTELAFVHEERGDLGDPPLETKPYQGFYLAVLHAGMFARDGSGIETYEDLPGVNFWPHAPGSSNRSQGQLALGPEGVDIWDNMNHVNVGVDEIAGAIEEERIDALIIDMNSYVGLGGGYVEQVDARTDIHAVKMSEEKQQLIKDHPIVPYFDLEPYGWEQDVLQEGMETMPAWGLEFQTFFHPDLRSDVINEVTQLAIEHNDMVRDSQEGFAQDAEQAASTVMPQYPVHPGVNAAFEELGVASDDWTIGE